MTDKPDGGPVDNKYHACVYAKFDNESDCGAWLIEHGIKQAIPYGGPVFSYSTEDESGYGDELESRRGVITAQLETIQTLRADLANEREAHSLVIKECNRVKKEASEFAAQVRSEMV